MDTATESRPLWTGTAYDRAAIGDLARDLRNREPAISWGEAQARAWDLAKVERRNDEAALRAATLDQLRREVAEAQAEARKASAPAAPKWTVETKPFTDKEGRERYTFVTVNVGGERAVAAMCDPARWGEDWRLISSDGDHTEEHWLTPGRALAQVAPLVAPELDRLIARHSTLAAASVAAAAGEDPDPPTPFPGRKRPAVPEPAPDEEPLPLAARSHSLACAGPRDPVVRSAPVDERSRQVRRAEEREAEKRAQRARENAAASGRNPPVSLSAAAVPRDDRDAVPVNRETMEGILYEATSAADAMPSPWDPESTLARILADTVIERQRKSLARLRRYRRRLER